MAERSPRDVATSVTYPHRAHRTDCAPGGSTRGVRQPLQSTSIPDIVDTRFHKNSLPSLPFPPDLISAIPVFVCRICENFERQKLQHSASSALNLSHLHAWAGCKVLLVMSMLQSKCHSQCQIPCEDEPIALIIVDLRSRAKNLTPAHIPNILVLSYGTQNRWIYLNNPAVQQDKKTWCRDGGGSENRQDFLPKARMHCATNMFPSNMQIHRNMQISKSPQVSKWKKSP